MKRETRILLAILSGLLVDFYSHLFLFPLLGKAQSNTVIRYSLFISTVIIIGIIVWRLTHNLTKEHSALVIKAGLIGTLSGFLIGVVGPILLRPDSPQGPLLGIFFTGPIGFMLGLTGGFFYGTSKYRGS